MNGQTAAIDLTLDVLPSDESKPCDFCSTMEHQDLIRERGLIEADFRLVNTYGVVFGYSCCHCVEGSVD